MDLNKDISDFCKGGQYSSKVKNDKNYCSLSEDRCPYYKKIRQHEVCMKYGKPSETLQDRYKPSVQSSYKKRR